MDTTDVIWGAIVIAAGIFIAVYGSLLFKFTLAAMGFGIGFVGAWWVLDGQSDTMRLLISMVVGGIGAVLLYSLAKFGLYIAGAVLGVVIAIVVGGIIDILGPKPDNIVMWILALGGLAGGGLFGHRLGQLIVTLATAAAGAFLIVDGFQIWFSSQIGGDVSDPSQTLAQKLALTMFLVFFALSALSQMNSTRLMQRVTRR